jgi:signal peptidase I
MRAYLRDTIAIFIMAIVIFLLLQATVQSCPIVGSCMEPTLQEEGQRLLSASLVYPVIL